MSIFQQIPELYLFKFSCVMCISCFCPLQRGLSFIASPQWWIRKKIQNRLYHKTSIDLISWYSILSKSYSIFQPVRKYQIRKIEWDVIEQTWNKYTVKLKAGYLIENKKIEFFSYPLVFKCTDRWHILEISVGWVRH